MSPNEIGTSRVEWRPSFRTVPSRFPPVGLFDRVASPDQLEAIYQLEGLTNPRLREEAGELSLVPPGDRVFGPGTAPIMAAFTHLNRSGSRFSSGNYGVYYCGSAEETAIRETVYHRERFLGNADAAPQTIDMRLYRANLAGELHDIREQPRAAELLNPDSYVASQTIGTRLRASGSNGIVYPSVRHSGGTCAAVFRPPLLGPARQSKHFGYRWDGQRITDVIEFREISIDLGSETDATDSH